MDGCLERDDSVTPNNLSKRKKRPARVGVRNLTFRYTVCVKTIHLFSITPLTWTWNTKKFCTCRKTLIWSLHGLIFSLSSNFFLPRADSKVSRAHDGERCSSQWRWDVSATWTETYLNAEPLRQPSTYGNCTYSSCQSNDIKKVWINNKSNLSLSLNLDWSFVPFQIISQVKVQVQVLRTRIHKHIQRTCCALGPRLYYQVLKKKKKVIAPFSQKTMNGLISGNPTLSTHMTESNIALILNCKTTKT